MQTTLAAELWKRHPQFKAKDIDALVKGIAEIVAETVANGERCLLPGIGALVAVDRSPRKGRNPLTGEVIKIPARRVVAFNPCKPLRELVNR